jgi:DNA repair exonuclease SbcCD nuclease subunit
MESEDVVLKFVHTADWHLGRPFRSFSKDGALRLSRARLDVLSRVLGEAERNQVHAVLCAGDLFDGPSPGADFRDGLLALLRTHGSPARPIFLLPGNHDPLTPESVWRDPRFRSALPDFVHVVDREMYEAPLGPDAVLYAVPCQSSAGQGDPTRLIPPRAAGDERVRVGLVHGSTFDLPEAQTNFPIARDAALERGLDYLAVGDTHGFRFVPPERLQPPTVYPGTPEQTAFDERDAGQVGIVFINRQRRARVERARVAQFQWEVVQVDSIDQLRALAARHDLANRVLRLRLELRVGVAEYEEARQLLDVLAGTSATQGRVGVLALEDEGLTLDVTSVDERQAELPEVLQAAVAKLKLAAADASTRAVAERALYHLLRLARDR